MAMLIVSRGTALGDTTTSGMFLAAFDPDVCDGMGYTKWTRVKQEALRFPDFRTAMEIWRAQSTVRPLRTDGKPNRPLTAYTVEVCDEDAPGEMW